MLTYLSLSLSLSLSFSLSLVLWQTVDDDAMAAWMRLGVAIAERCPRVGVLKPPSWKTSHSAPIWWRSRAGKRWERCAAAPSSGTPVYLFISAVCESMLSTCCMLFHIIYTHTHTHTRTHTRTHCTVCLESSSVCDLHQLSLLSGSSLAGTLGRAVVLLWPGLTRAALHAQLHGPADAQEDYYCETQALQSAIRGYRVSLGCMLVLWSRYWCWFSFKCFLQNAHLCTSSVQF